MAAPMKAGFEEEVRTMLRREGEFTGERGVRIWYQSWRPEAPKAILVVAHGLGEHSGRYGNLVNYLVPRGYAVYALDHRGHGRSGGPRGYIDRFGDFVADVERLAGVARLELPGLPLFVLGHSMGGPIALRYAREYPQGLQGVIASSPLLRAKLPVSAGKLFLAGLMSRLQPRYSQHSGLPASALSHDPQVAAAYAADPLVHDLVSARLYTEMMAAGRSVLAWAPEMRVPCLLLVSGADALVDPEASKEFFTNLGCEDKALYVYEGFFHEVFNEIERERPLSDLAAWLDAHLPGRA